MSSDRENDDFHDFSSDEELQENILIGPKKKLVPGKDVFTSNNDDDIDESESEYEDALDNIESDGSLREGQVPETREEQTLAKTANLETIDEDRANAEDSRDTHTITNTKNGETSKEKSSSDKAAERLKKRLQVIHALKKNSKHKTGVIYLSSIPPYMKPAKMRQILSRFGPIDRLFLKREDEKKHKQRVRSGGNRKVMYEEGWAEFIRKRDAKLCAQTLNSNIIGGKKGSFYHDDILNVKYLPGFKWADLTEQIARENDVRQAKLEMEISQANKLNAEFVKNVEKSKMLEKIRNSKKRKATEQQQVDTAEGEAGGEKYKTNKRSRIIKQHRVATNRADAPEDIKAGEASSSLDSVLHNLL